MSTESRVRLLAQAIGADVKALYTALAGKASATHAASHATGGGDALTPAAIGAVAKSDLVFNVKDYGAVGNGATDDKAAIQAAINAANSAGGGTIYYPRATYALTTGLTSYSNVIHRGEPGTVLLATGTQTSMFTMASRSNPTFESLILDGGTSQATTLLNFITCTNVTVRGCTFSNATNSGASGVRLNGGTGVKVDACRFDTLTRGVFGTNNSGNWLSRVKLLDCYFTGMADAAVFCTGNQAAGAATEDVTIDTCRAENFRAAGTTRSGFYFVVSAGATVKHRGTKIAKCTLIGRYEAFSAGTGNSDFITFYDIEDGSVTDCDVMGGGDVGISLSRSNRCVASGNRSRDNQSFGIGFWDSSNCAVNGNVVWNNRRNYGYLPIPVTWDAATDTFTSPGHGLTNGTQITFPAASLPAGIGTAWGTKYVRDATTDTFKVANTSGGAANDVTDSGSGSFFLGGSLRGPKSGILARQDAATCTSNVLTNNRCYDTQTPKTQEYGISVEAGVTDTVVTGNHVKGNLIAGVLDAGTGTLVASNLT